jgi:O-antigen/teichoic acid export membrane protein
VSTIPDSDADALANDVLRSADAGGRVARGSLIRGTGYVLGVGFGLATSILLLRHLGVAEYGQYGTIAALMGLVLGITDGGMTAIGARELSVTRPGAQREALASSLMTLRAIAAVIGVAVGVVFAAISYEPLLALGAVLVGISVVLQSSQAMATVPLLAELRAAPIAVFDGIRQALTLIGVFLLVVAGADLLPFFALQIPVVAITLIATVLFVRRTFALGISFHRPHLGFLIRETLPMSVAVVLNSLYLGAMVVIVSLVSNDVDTGIYAAPARIMEVLVFLASVMISIAIPVLAVSGAEDRPRFRAGLQLLLQSGLAIAVAITIALVAAAPALMPLIGGSAFAASGTVLQVQAIALVGIFASQALQFALVTLRAQRSLIYANAVALTVLLAGGLILVPRLGPTGGALAVVIGEGVLVAALLVALARVDRSSVPRAGFLLRLTLSAAAGSAVLMLPIGDWAQAILGAAVFGAAAVATRAVPREAIHAVIRSRAKVEGA